MSLTTTTRTIATSAQLRVLIGCLRFSQLVSNIANRNKPAVAKRLSNVMNTTGYKTVSKVPGPASKRPPPKPIKIGLFAFVFLAAFDCALEPLKTILAWDLRSLETPLRLPADAAPPGEFESHQAYVDHFVPLICLCKC